MFSTVTFESAFNYFPFMIFGLFDSESEIPPNIAACCTHECEIFYLQDSLQAAYLGCDS